MYLVIKSLLAKEKQRLLSKFLDVRTSSSSNWPLDVMTFLSIALMSRASTVSNYLSAACNLRQAYHRRSSKCYSYALASAAVPMMPMSGQQSCFIVTLTAVDTVRLLFACYEIHVGLPLPEFHAYHPRLKATYACGQSSPPCFAICIAIAGHVLQSQCERTT
jgi:hypothetical protein